MIDEQNIETPVAAAYRHRRLPACILRTMAAEYLIKNVISKSKPD
jgi:hypothetical protein